MAGPNTKKAKKTKIASFAIYNDGSVAKTLYLQSLKEAGINITDPVVNRRLFGDYQSPPQLMQRPMMPSLLAYIKCGQCPGMCVHQMPSFQNPFEYRCMSQPYSCMYQIAIFQNQNIEPKMVNFKSKDNAKNKQTKTECFPQNPEMN
jgi:hypothetical protein